MNDIPKMNSTPVQLKAAPVIAAAKVQKSGKDLPSAEQAASKPSMDIHQMQEHMEAAVAKMNEYIQSTQRDLHFSYDKSAGETVVKVLDRTTQEVIRQIPNETFLKLAHSKDFDGNFHLFSAQA
jgi:flagellar protein FlaG